MIIWFKDKRLKECLLVWESTSSSKQNEQVFRVDSVDSLKIINKMHDSLKFEKFEHFTFLLGQRQNFIWKCSFLSMRQCELNFRGG